MGDEPDDGLGDLAPFLERRSREHAARIAAVLETGLAPSLPTAVESLCIKVYLEALLLEMGCLGKAKLELTRRVGKLLDQAEAQVPALQAARDQAMAEHEAAQARARLMGGT